MADDDKFVPTFAMPVIAPAPFGYTGDAAAYYAELAGQTQVTTTQVEVLPEQQLPPTTPLDKKGLLVTITNPDATFQPAVPITGTTSVLAPLPTFGTLFAMMGGWLSYRRSTAAEGLNSFFPDPYASLQAPVQYSAPAGLLTPAWGTLVLTLWGADYDVLQAALGDHPGSLVVYYLGVDEASLLPLLKPALKELFPEQAYNDHIAAQGQLSVAKQKMAPLRDVIEAITVVPYGTAITAPVPSYNQLIDDHLAAFVNGTTAIMVKGGKAIGKAIQCNAGFTSSQPIAQVELWFVDAGSPQQFLSPFWILPGALIYDF